MDHPTPHGPHVSQSSGDTRCFPTHVPHCPDITRGSLGSLLLLLLITLPPSLNVLEDGYKRAVRVISRLSLLNAAAHGLLSAVGGEGRYSVSINNDPHCGLHKDIGSWRAYVNKNMSDLDLIASRPGHFFLLDR